MPGSLRLVFDCNPAGERWFEFLLLKQDDDGLFLSQVSMQWPGLRGLLGCRGWEAGGYSGRSTVMLVSATIAADIELLNCVCCICLPLLLL